MANRRLLLALFFWGTCSAAWAQFPVGREFQVNSYTLYGQRGPALAADAGGNFVVVWSGNRGSSIYDVFGQRFNASGVRQGSEFQVNSYATGWQEEPAVLADALGNFVVVWQSFYQYGYGVYGQRFNASGVRQGGEFRVSSSATSYHLQPAMSADATGDFVVVWSSIYMDGSGGNVLGRRFDAAGLPQSSEFRVNTYTSGWRGRPAVASDASGNFVVVWHSSPGQDGSGSGIFGQRFDYSGVRQGSEFRVNTYTTGSQFGPAVASHANGNFVVVWVSSGQDGSSYGVFGQRFSASGIAEGSEFKVNAYTLAAQSYPAVASAADGKFVVVWQSAGQDGSSYGIFGQRFHGSEVPQGRGFRVNSYTVGHQREPALALDAAGNFVVVWQSDGQDGSYDGIFGQRYGDLIFRDGFQQ